MAAERLDGYAQEKRVTAPVEVAQVGLGYGAQPTLACHEPLDSARDRQGVPPQSEWPTMSERYPRVEWRRGWDSNPRSP